MPTQRWLHKPHDSGVTVDKIFFKNTSCQLASPSNHHTTRFNARTIDVVRGEAQKKQRRVFHRLWQNNMMHTA